jgi:hypothetical protein
VISTKNPDTERDPDCTSKTNEPLNCYLYVSGQDASGYTWPINIWGAKGRFQQITKRVDADAGDSQKLCRCGDRDSLGG